MKSLIIFLKALFEDLERANCISTIRDYNTVATRFEDEGLSFITITLPNYGKDFERCLAAGRILPDAFPGFRRRAGLPLFMAGFLERIFDRKDGLLLEVPDIRCIYSIRQVSYLAKKVDMACTPKRRRKAVVRYVECDEEVRQHQKTARYDSDVRDEFRRVSRLLWGDVLASLDAAIYHGDIVPKHGPGATAEKKTSNGKYTQSEWTARLEASFPSLEYVFPNYGWYDSAPYQSLDILSPEAERPVRVIDVPKTLKTPRIIAIEPSCVMYMQQGLQEAIKSAFREDYNSRNFVCYDSQSQNRKLAEFGSKSGLLATLDLKEASDRVSMLHVADLLHDVPRFKRAVFACRSTKADVDGDVITLAKYASMGSALCFPMEAMVFTTIVFIGIARSLGRPLTRKDIDVLVGKVRVYGDDIIVPVEFAEPVIKTLEAFGLVVNTTKSFWTGWFRESCGKDFFAGHDVSVVKLGKVFPSSLEHASEIVSLVKFRNRLAKARWVEYDSSLELLDRWIGRLIPFPFVSEDSAILGRVDPTRIIVEKVHPTLHIPLVRGMTVQVRKKQDSLADYGALMKFFLKRSEMAEEDKDHLERAGRAVSFKLKYSWGRP